MAASSAAIPCSASSKTTATSARSKLLRAITTESFSVSACVLPLRRIPAVSMRRKVCSEVSSRVSTLSRVVPATGETIARSSPNSRFSNDDFPTFGRPTIARRNSLTGSAGVPPAFWFSLTVDPAPRMLLTSASSISPIPFPCSAEMGKTSANPKR